MAERAVFTMVADVPNELAAAWLQHVRDFDVRHPECRFQIQGEIDAPTEHVRRMLGDIRPHFAEIVAIVKEDGDTPHAEADEKGEV